MSETAAEQDRQKDRLVQGLILQGYAKELLISDSENTDGLIVTDARMVGKIAWDHDIQEPRFVTNGFNRLTDHFYNFHRQGVEELCPCPLQGRYQEGSLAEFTPDSLVEVVERLKADPDALGRYGIFATGAQNVIKIAELLDYVTDFERRRREYNEREKIRGECSLLENDSDKIEIIQEKAKGHFDPGLLIRELQGIGSTKRGEDGENPDAQVREMTPDEVHELGNILRIHPGYRETYAQRIRNHQIKMFAAYSDNRPVAVGTITYEGPLETTEDQDKITETDVIRLLGKGPWAHNMWTCEGYRGRGLAPCVMLARIEEIRQRGGVRIAMCVKPDNQASIKANSRLGFKPYLLNGKPFVFLAHPEGDEPSETILMVKNLTCGE
ncbi:GNAT family N-acetyltransferase [Candidatus Saccharibacteria bacterium]|nr:GNAT family N-acetyltransferase [Candidatus Saccharibacteria bacterium]